MKKILIALDYNPSAQIIAETGALIAKAFAAEATLLHIISNPIYYSSTAYSPIMGFGGYADLDFMQPDIVKSLTSASFKFLEKSKSHMGGTNINCLVEEGDVPDMILETAKKIHAELIVMGSHSRRWLEAIVMGSSAQDVVHHSVIPVLLIPTKKKN